MTLTIRHATLSSVSDEGVPGEIGPSEWNEGHTIIDSEPIVILATGQSNFVQTPAFTWSPETRARLWNYNHADGNIGTAFVALPSTTINVADKFASEIARLNPTRSVYLINTAMAFSGNTISYWLPGTSSPDEYLQITNNVPAALAAIGASKVDMLLWYQGEAQTPATCEMHQYPADWEIFFGRLLLESWFPRATPVVIFGIAPATISGLISSDIQNGNLQAVVGADPDCRRFIYSGALAAGYWLDTAHLTSAGYDQLGKMAAAAFVYGSTRNALIDPVRATLRPEVIARTTLRNLIVGGDFTTNPWQRGTSFVSAPNGQFTADRWRWTQTGSGVVDVTKAADAPTITQAGVFTQHCLDIAVTTADASIAATDQYFIRQILEGLSTSFLGFGQSNARPITVSFWVKSTKTGTFWLSLRPASGTRSYVASYAINANNIWEYKRVTIAGDVTGTWLYDTGHGISVTWLLAAGSNFVSTANAWSAGNFLAGADPNANAMDTVDNHFKLALVQVEEGVGASPFEVLPQDVVLDRCRRHYRKSFPQATAPAQNVGSTVGATFVVSDVASAVFGTRVEFDTSMRAAPTITTYNPSAANANWRDTTNSADRTVTVSDQSESGFVVTGAAGAAGASNYIHWQASADL